MLGKPSVTYSTLCIVQTDEEKDDLASESSKFESGWASLSRRCNLRGELKIQFPNDNFYRVVIRENTFLLVAFLFFS